MSAEAKDLPVPVLNNIYDIAEKRDEICRYVESHTKDKDIVYSFFHSTRLDSRPSLPGVVIGGSSALALVSTLLFNHCLPKPPNQVSWSANDCDIFLLNQTMNDKDPNKRRIPPVEFIAVPCKTVDELLVSFDLPCCRVATNTGTFVGDWWISLHAMYAIITGNYPIPLYLQSQDAFTQKLKTLATESQASHLLLDSIRDVWTRFQERLDKYETRGMKPIWVDTNAPTSWMINRFAYFAIKSNAKQENQDAKANQQEKKDSKQSTAPCVASF